MNNFLDQWNMLVGEIHLRSYKKNDVIFRQGESGKGFYYVEEGMVIVKLLTDHGEERIIDFVLPGELFGETGIRGNSYLTTAVAGECAAVYFFSNECFDRICSADHSISDIVMNSLINKIRLLAESVSILDSSVEKQTAHFLLKLFQKMRTGNLPITQTSLAHYIGTSRITVYKLLQKWNKAGILEVSNRKIHILDPERLQNIIKQ